MPGSNPRSRHARRHGRPQRHARFLLRRRPLRADCDAALAQARRMIGEGAAIIDIGGESTRPGAQPGRASHEELERVHAGHRGAAPRIAGRSSPSTPANPRSCAPRSRAGADIINDVRALRGARRARGGGRDAAPASVSCTCRASRAPCRTRRTTTMSWPRSRHSWPSASRRAARPASTRERIAVDPGFGFGKTRRAQSRAAQTPRRACRRWAYPLRWACRASPCWRSCTGRAVEERAAGSVALAAIAVLNGARIVRAHDVAATVDAVRVAAAMRKGEGFDGT